MALFRELKLPCTCTTTGKTLHAKHEELAVRLLCRGITSRWRWQTCDGNREGGGRKPCMVKSCMLLFPVSIPKTGSGTKLMLIFLKSWICLNNNVSVCEAIFGERAGGRGVGVVMFANTSGCGHQAGDSEKRFWCVVWRLICQREMCRDNLGCSLIWALAVFYFSGDSCFDFVAPHCTYLPLEVKWQTAHPTPREKKRNPPGSKKHDPGSYLKCFSPPVVCK